MLDCFDELADPNVPIELSYVSKGGVISLWADRYQFDLTKNRFSLIGFKATDPSRKPLASIELLDVHDVTQLISEQTPIVVDAKRVWMRVSRLQSGKLQIQDFLPKSNPQKSERRFKITAKKITVVVEDFSSRKRVAQSLSSDQIDVFGYDSNWLGAGLVTLEGSGNAQLVLQGSPKGTFLSLATEGLRQSDLVTSVVASLSSDLPLIEGAEFKGATNVEFINDAHPHLFAHIQAKSKTAKLRDVSAHDLVAEGALTESGFRGTFKGYVPSGKVAMDGVVDWSREIWAQAKVTGEIASLAQLPKSLTQDLPRRVEAKKLKVEGYASVHGLKNIQIDGLVQSGLVSYDSSKAERVQADFSWNSSSSFSVRNLSADYLGHRVTGSIASIGSHQLTGFLVANDLPISTIASQFNQSGLAGTIDLQTSVGGTFAEPTFLATVQGNLSIKRHEIKNLSGVFFATMSGSKRDVKFQRAAFDSSAGLVTATGTVDSKLGLDLTVKARGIKPGLLVSEATGSVDTDARLSGSLTNPKALGFIQAFEPGYQKTSLVAATTDYTADLHSVRFTNLKAAKGSASLEGSAFYDFRSQIANADFSVGGVQIAEWVGGDVVGLVEAPNVRLEYSRGSLSGTFLAKSNSIVTHDTKIDHLQMVGQIENSVAVVHDLSAEVAGGKLTAWGSYNLDSKTGTANAEVENSSVQDLLSIINNQVAVDGKISGSLVARVEGRKVSVTGTGTTSDLTLNDTILGGGPWEASYDGAQVGLSGSFGALLPSGVRAIELEKVRYDVPTRQIEGNLYASNVRIEDLSAAVIPSLHTLNAEQINEIQKFGGAISVGAEAKGDLSNPDIYVNSFQIENLKYDGSDIGLIKSSLNRVAQKWTIQSASYEGGLGALNLSGWLQEGKDLSIDLDAKNVAFDAIAKIFPTMPAVSGTADLSVFASGEIKKPEIIASLNAKNLFTSNSETKTAGLGINLYRIAVSDSAENGIDVEGVYNFGGIIGSIKGSAPFHYPFEIPDGLVKGEVTLKADDLTRVPLLDGAFDRSRTSGKVSGKIDVTYQSGKLDTNGKFSLNAPQVALANVGENPFGVKRVDTTLKEVAAEINLNSSGLQATASGESSRGGKASGVVSVPTGDLSELIRNIKSRGISALLELPVMANASITNLGFHQTAGEGSFFNGTVAGVAEATGSIGKPKLAGKFDISNLETVVPPINSEGKQSETPTIDPTFDISLNLSNSARIRSAGADLYVLGSGSVKGSLSQLAVRANLGVEKGSIRLPGGNLRVEQGGQILLRYGSTNSGISTGSLNVDLKARTSLLASRYGENDQRYDINVQVKGDLLDEKGLNLAASSDPPDLTQSQILAKLGRTDLIENLGSGNHNTNTQMRQALLGYALPSLLDNITGSIANTLGLEYLTLDIDSLQQTNLSVGKSFGRELSMQIRSQVGQPAPGIRPSYDVRFVYSPKVISRRLPRLNFSIGADQDRPWKATIDYSLRFGPSTRSRNLKPVIIYSPKQ